MMQKLSTDTIFTSWQNGFLPKKVLTTDERDSEVFEQKVNDDRLIIPAIKGGVRVWVQKTDARFRSATPTTSRCCGIIPQLLAPRGGTYFALLAVALFTRTLAPFLFASSLSFFLFFFPCLLPCVCFGAMYIPGARRRCRHPRRPFWYCPGSLVGCVFSSSPRNFL